MRKDLSMRKWNNTHRLVKYTNLSITTGIIASLLLTLTPNTIASAETNTDHIEKEKIEHLYNEFHTLIQSNEDSVEDSAGETSPLVSESEELRLVKDNLLTAFENISSIELVTQLRAANLTIEQLDLIFDEAINMLLEAEDSESVGEIEAIEVPEVESEPIDVNEVTDDRVEEPTVDEEVPEVSQHDEKPTEKNQEQNKTAQLNLASTSIKHSEKPAQSSTQTARAILSTSVSEEKAKETSVYIVKAGDTLNSIARKYNTTANNLAALNKITNPNRIFVGQTLTVSGTLQEKENNLDELHKPLSSAEFIDVVGEQARVVASNHNLYASVMIAQAALESGYGKSTLSSVPNHNLFGIKGSYNGESVTMRTSEYSDATGWITIYDAFKKYPSYTESLLDNARLLRNGLNWSPGFYGGTWIENTTTYKDATAWLEGRYATDPTYSTKLNNIIANYNLTRFDITPNGELVMRPAPTPKPVEKPVTPSTSVSFYTVRAGDNLNRISRTYNMTVSELKQLNGLSSDLIFVGQSLKVNSQNIAPAPIEAPETATKPVEDSWATLTNGTYNVKAGDTIFRIARAHNLSVSELKQLNHLNSNLIFVGQNLEVTTPKSAPEPIVKPSTSQTTGTYSVKAGDTLFRIARAHNLSVSELKQLNHLSSNLIVVGQNLKVTASKSAPEPEVKPSTSQTTGTYSVKAGDTIFRIARAHNLSVSELKQLNHLNSNLIVVGQNLKVTASKSAPEPEVKPSTSQTTGTYSVKAGDTLFRIARAHNLSVSELKQLNHLKSDLIFVGQHLKVSNGVQTSTQVSRPASSQADKKVVTPSSSTGVHFVKAGDTLFNISRTYKMSVSELKRVNNLRSDLIFVGQRLKVANSSRKASSQSSSNKSHRVVSGDTLSGLAVKYGTTVSSLKAKNQLKSALIFIGQTLNI